MQEEQLRDRATRALGLDAIDDDVWYAALGDGSVEDALLAPETFPVLVERLRELGARLGGRTRRKTASPRIDRPLFREEEQRRARALYEYFAKLASTLPMVRDFRELVLGGQLLADERAREWVLSDGVAQLPLYAFTVHRLSPTKDLGRIVEAWSEEESGTPFECVTVRFAQSGIETEFRRRLLGRDERTLLAYPSPTDSVARVAVHDHSILDELQRTVRQLCRRFPWEEHRATWFVLTGAVPLWWPIRRSDRLTTGTGFKYRSLTLTVEPWVSAQTLVRAYRDAQRRMLGGRENRPLRAKNLELFRFCTDRMDEDGELPAWPSLMREWNRSHPDEEYESARTFARDYGRARDHVAFPDYDEPW